MVILIIIIMMIIIINFQLLKLVIRIVRTFVRSLFVFLRPNWVHHGTSTIVCPCRDTIRCFTHPSGIYVVTLRTRTLGVFLMTCPQRIGLYKPSRENGNNPNQPDERGKPSTMVTARKPAEMVVRKPEVPKIMFMSSIQIPQTPSTSQPQTWNPTTQPHRGTSQTYIWPQQA